MIETNSSICTWADTTFGLPASDASIAARALVEMAKLVTAVVNGEPAERIGVEIADVVIVLARMGRAMGLDVHAMISVSRTTLPSSNAIRCAALAAENLANLLRDSQSFDGMRPLSLKLCAVWLENTALACGINLPAAIDAKMAVNRARTWVPDGNGHGQHAEDGK